MSEYEILIKTGQVKGRRSLFRFDGIKAPGVEEHPSVPGIYRLINASGYVSEKGWEGVRYLFTREGAVVSPGQSLYVKGFTQIFQYDTGAGLQSFDEDDWSIHFVSETTPVSNVYTVPAGVRSVRVQASLAEGEPFSEELFYIAATGGARPAFIGIKDKWERLDIGREKPALTLQNNDLAELKDRQADYSQELVLPLTRNNKRILGLPNHLDSLTSGAYKVLGCRLRAGGNTLAGAGAGLYIDQVDEEGIHCQILGAVSSLTDTLSDTPMSALATPSFDRTSAVYSSLLSGGDTPDGLGYSAATFLRDGKRMPFMFDARVTMPHVRLLKLFDAVLASHGFAWQHNLDDYPITQDLVLPVVGLTPDEDSLERFEGYVSSNILTGAHHPDVRRYWGFDSVPPQGFPAGWRAWGLSGQVTDDTHLSFEAQENCSFDFFYSRNAYTEPGKNTVSFVTSAVAAGRDVTDPETMAETLTFTTRISLSKGDVFTLTVMNMTRPTGPWMTYTHAFRVSNFSAEVVPVGGTVHAPRNLGFETQGAFVKAVLQALGLVMLVDWRSMTVRTYTMGEVYRRKSEALDWSSKIQGGATPTTTFRLRDYARLNRVAFKENEDDKVTREGTFIVADETLESEKTLFELAFESGADYPVTPHGANKHANVPLFTPAEGDGLTGQARLLQSSFNEGTPHLLIQYSYEGTPCLKHDGAHPQQLLDTFYTELTDKMLRKAKVLTVKMNLTPLDIELFDPLRPIYLDQFGAYFYVNKISNFIAGRLTTVELIKL